MHDGGTRAAGQERPAWQAGDFFTLPGFADCYEIASASSAYIVYEARDGVTQIVDDTICMSLARKTARWIPATPEQVARYRRLYRPAPQNWD
ncbi:hypothetical protein ACFY64_31755 [Streptomyces collinus]|uniref:hypothetical protein n=1 Tax=Streptomyces collinus TaxID=42684 RepID=UPI003682FF69